MNIDTTIFRPATFVERSIDNLSTTLIQGSLLVVLVLALFLFCRLVRRGGRWRMANAVPVSGAAGVTTVVAERAQRGCSLKLA